jgi:hypothetical protein
MSLFYPEKWALARIAATELPLLTRYELADHLAHTYGWKEHEAVILACRVISEVQNTWRTWCEGRWRQRRHSADPSPSWENAVRITEGD